MNLRVHLLDGSLRRNGPGEGLAGRIEREEESASGVLGFVQFSLVIFEQAPSTGYGTLNESFMKYGSH